MWVTKDGAHSSVPLSTQKHGDGERRVAESKFVEGGRDKRLNVYLNVHIRAQMGKWTINE